MNEPILYLLLAVFVGATVALFWILAKQGADRIAAQYRLLAGRFGLELSEPPARMLGFFRTEPFVHGIWRGREMSISAPGKGLQNTRQMETVLKMELRLQDFRLQGTAAGLLGRFRQRDSSAKGRWMSGDADFDAAVDLRTSDPARTEQVFTPERRERLAELLKGGKSTLYVSKGVMAFTDFGLIANDATRERFERVAAFLDELAQAFERAA